MCGFVKRKLTGSALALLEQVGLANLFDKPDHETHQFYPAFGGNTHRTIDDLIIREDEEPKRVNAVWWFDCTEEDGHLICGTRTTFNARNLSSAYWRHAIKKHRGIVVATGLGESKKMDAGKSQFLMESDEPFLLGAVYRPFKNGQYSTAIITRDSHPRFEEYHDKAFPLFLPLDRQFIDDWLNPRLDTNDAIEELLGSPRLYPTLHVSRVKTFKRGELLEDRGMLAGD